MEMKTRYTCAHVFACAWHLPSAIWCAAGLHAAASVAERPPDFVHLQAGGRGVHHVPSMPHYPCAASVPETCRV